MSFELYTCDETGNWVSDNGAFTVSRVRITMAYDPDNTAGYDGTDGVSAYGTYYGISDPVCEVWLGAPVNSDASSVSGEVDTTAQLRNASGRPLEIPKGASFSKLSAWAMYSVRGAELIYTRADGTEVKSTRQRYAIPLSSGVFRLYKADDGKCYVRLAFRWFSGATNRAFDRDSRKLTWNFTRSDNWNDGADSAGGWAYKPESKQAEFNTPIQRNASSAFGWGADNEFWSLEPCFATREDGAVLDMTAHPIATVTLPDGTEMRGLWDGTFYRYWE